MKLFKSDEEILLEETKEKKAKEPSGKSKPIILTIVAFVLLLITVGSIYLSFFSFQDLRNLGYKNSEIFKIAKNGIADKVEEYNPCLIYSLNSEHFNSNKVNYYILFNAEFDYTEYINILADVYQIEEVNQFKDFLTIDEIMQLSVLDKVNNIANFAKCYQKGYTLAQSINLSNSLQDYSIETILTFDILNSPNIYSTLLETGYSDVAIAKLYDKFGKEDFERLANIKYFKQLEDLLFNTAFKKENMARYLMYIDAKNVNTTEAVNAVNNNADVVATNKINYSSYYVENPNVVNEVKETTLINKANVLKDDYVPNDLVEVDPTYRANNHKLVKIVAEQFVALSKACKEELKITVVAYNGYLNKEIVENTYSDLLKSSKKITKNDVDSSVPRANYSENQTGLAIDVASKYQTYSEFINSQSYDWFTSHAHEYGFIQRYPEGKEFITGYRFQAYHFRYVTVDVATLIYNSSWTLEEYHYLIND